MEVVADTVVVVVVAVVVDVAVVVVAVEHGVVAEASFGCVIAMVELLVEVLKFLVVQNLGPRDGRLLHCLTTSHLVWIDAVMQNRCRMKKKNGVDGDGAFATSDLATRFALLMSQVPAVATSDLVSRLAQLMSQVLAVATSDLATRFALSMSQVLEVAKSDVTPGFGLLS